MADVDARIEELEKLVRGLQDERDIKDLFARWHYACTGGFNGVQSGRMEALECLSEDATIEIQGLHAPGQGPKGREQYTEFWDYYYGDAGPLPYVFQTSLGERVEVNGDEAVHYTNMLIITWPRGTDPSLGLSRRINWLRREPQGWRITKTTTDGGYHVPLDKIGGNLNPLPDPEPRTPWTYKGD
jgi:SnoaL-like domain